MMYQENACYTDEDMKDLVKAVDEECAYLTPCRNCQQDLYDDLSDDGGDDLLDDGWKDSDVELEDGLDDLEDGLSDDFLL